MKTRVLKWIGGICVVVMVATFFPVTLCGWGAGKWFEGDLDRQVSLARGVSRLLFDEDMSLDRFRTGSSQFNGEWLFGSYLMAGVGYAQMSMEHPELKQQNLERTRQCIEGILAPHVRAFDRRMWGEEPLDGMASGNHHAAYLGYFNFLLGLERLAFGDDRYAKLNDQLTAFFIQRLAASEHGLLESYPSEIYPVDNCFVIGSIGLHQRVTGQDHSKTIRAWSDVIRRRYLDEKSRLLIQAVNPFNGLPYDAPRGSGTALGLLGLHYADPQLAAELYEGVKKSLAGTWLGFGGVREYPDGHSGSGDIDSGPIIFGFGLSATGFSIGGARRYNDGDFFRRLCATARLCGAPVERDGQYEYVSGGPLGNAILFAMLTTPRDVGSEGRVPP